MQLPGKTTRPHRVFMRGTVRMKRHTHHQRVGLPGFKLLRHLVKAGIALGGDRALWLRGAHEPVAHRKTGTFQAEVERQKSLQVQRHHRLRIDAGTVCCGAAHA